MSIEKTFDIPFVASLALREKQIQQNYRPIIAVHKWFARRPGTLFRALILSEFASPPLRDAYFKSHALKGLRVADPFMGGGTPLIEANRVGCDVVGCDINPMAYWIVQREIEHLDLDGYRKAALRIFGDLSGEVGSYYRTRCTKCESPDAHAKYFLWVKTHACNQCGREFDLMPGYLIAQDVRHPRNVFVCATCGELSEADDRTVPGSCSTCGTPLNPKGPATRGRCRCPGCGTQTSFPEPALGAPRHRMFAIEYFCHRCRPTHEGRFFKKPDQIDRQNYNEADRRFSELAPDFVPSDEIPGGDESDRLHRWGYRRYREMFNARQLLGLEFLSRAIHRETNDRIRRALATNLSDLLRYQNMLCRYDTMALKSLDIFSVHGFPVGLIQCESNLMGIADSRGKSIGSGGWSNITRKYAVAKAYCDSPFEVTENGKGSRTIYTEGEWIGDVRNGSGNRSERRSVQLYCGDATDLDVEPASLDAVFTDPPYFANVQYAELMDFCYVWLRRLVGRDEPSFAKPSTRHAGELTGNEAMGRGIEHFAGGLSAVFGRMARALKRGAPFAFTYHHNDLAAYYPIAVAILDAHLVCSASLPCPGEMGGSIHISGTGSSIIDTIFVCRSTGMVPRGWIVDSAQGAAHLVDNDVARLREGGVEPTQGDIRCLVYGHLVRLAVWRLRDRWQHGSSATEKLACVSSEIRSLPPLQDVLAALGNTIRQAPRLQMMAAREATPAYGETEDEISF